MTQLSALITNYSDATKNFLSEGEKCLKASFKEFLKEVPEITLIKWNQYTPYFNDGDTCEFHRCEIWLSNATDTEMIGTDSEDVSEDYEFETDARPWMVCGYTDKKDYPKEIKDKYEYIQKMLKLWSQGCIEDIYLAVFGDHVTVSVTKSKIDVEEYSHD